MPAATLKAMPGDILGWFDEGGVIGYEDHSNNWACLQEGATVTAQGADVAPPALIKPMFHDFSVEACYGKSTMDRAK